jgi:Secretion system C-terminal sorting domain
MVNLFRFLIIHAVMAIFLVLSGNQAFSQCDPLQSSFLSGGGIYCDFSQPSIGMGSTNPNQTYVFKHNGVPILFRAPGEPAPVTVHPGPADGGNLSYTIINMTAADAGRYTVTTYNTCGDSLQINSVRIFYSGIGGLVITSVRDDAVSFRWNTITSGTQYSYDVTEDQFNPPTDPSFTNDTSATVTGLTPGTTYYIYVSGECDNGGDANWDTLSFTTASLPCELAKPLVPSFTTPNGATTFCAGGNFLLTSNSAQGNQWYKDSVSVAPPASGSTYNVLVSGKYMVRVSDAGGCYAFSPEKNITAFPVPPTPVVTPSNPAPICTGDSVMLTSSSPAGNQWYQDGGPLAGAISQIYKSVVGGSYAVQVTNSKGCTAVSSGVTVTVNTKPLVPVVSPADSASFCSGDSITLTSDAAQGNQWYKDGSALPGENIQTLLVKSSGSYSVQVTGTGGCVNNSNPVIITVMSNPSTPLVTPATTVTLCSGDSILLSSSFNANNQWYRDGSLISGAVNPIYQVKSPGNYSVRVSAATGCAATSVPTAVITGAIPAIPIITVTDTLDNCQNEKLLTSSAATGNQWIRDGADLTSENFVYYYAKTTGSYALRVTNSSGCSSSSAAVIVSNLMNPTAPVITTSDSLHFCEGGSALLRSSAGSENQWLKNGAPISGANGQTYTANTSGSYTVQATTGSCTISSLPENILVTSNPGTPTTIPSGQLSLCAGDTVSIRSSAASGNQWYKDGVLIVGANGQFYNTNITGTYTVKVNSGSCISGFSQPFIFINSAIQVAPTVTAGGPLTFCSGGSVLLNSSSSGGPAYQWYENAVAIEGATSQSFSAAESGTYSVKIKPEDACQPISNDVTVTVTDRLPAPDISINYTGSFCEGGEIILSSSADENNQWLVDGGVIPDAVSKTWSAKKAGNYSVVLGYGTSCSSSSPTVPVTIDSVSSKLKASVRMYSGVLSSDSLSGNQWYLNDSLIEGATGYSYIPVATGNYRVRITSNGCVSNLSDPYTVKESDLITPYMIIYPNPAFDHITVSNMGSDPVTAQIFNMLGQKIKTVSGITGMEQIHITELTGGFYVILITDEKTQKSTRKIILKQ